MTQEKERVSDIAIELSMDECEKEFNKIGQWEREYNGVFRDHRILEVYYENLATSMDRARDRILDFLGDRRRHLETRRKEQILRPLSDIIKNYEELKAQITGTAWEGFFED